MSRQRLRVFVSSPGDVSAAREVAAQIIEKVARDYARFFSIEPYLWEYEPMLASGHFQDSIEPPSRFDAVILILESRLGTLLPERTPVREYRGIDGRSPVTGTEWEYEDALAAARERGVPDVLVYRSRRKAQIDTWDPQSRQAVLAQIEALEAFWSRHFSDRVKFIGGYSEFLDLEQFAERLESDLRSCVERRIATTAPQERSHTERLWPKPPFRGLERYELEHAPIFFGREAAIGTALLRLITSAEALRPFLLILGASGSGKSSLVLAGVVPRLLVPKRVSGTAFLRRVVFRASDTRADEDLFDSLARRLTEGGRDGIGLAELIEGPEALRGLASHLRESASHPELPFTMVLDRLAAAARGQGRMLEHEQSKLILVVDQMEELFTLERVRPEERALFIRLLGGLVRSNRVWVIATMRADFWHRASEVPELLRLADGQGRLDLAAPSPAEVSQMIRGPAEAAAVNFETLSSTGIPLNDFIAEAAAAEPGVLPLLSYLLDQLYLRDVEQAGGSTLTYASYQALGGLKGAIATRADAILGAQPQEAQRALRQILFALVRVDASSDGTERFVARRAPMTKFPEGSAKRRLVDALLDPTARLLVADSTSHDGATIALAHEALISEWRTARDYIIQNAEALRIRRTLEDRFARWQALGAESSAGARAARRGVGALLRLRRGMEHGLLTDVDLNDARRVLRDYGEELDAPLVAYIKRSIEADRKRRNAALRTAAVIAAVMTLLAAGAIYEATIATQQRQVAQRESATATHTADFLVSVFKNANPVENQGNSITARTLLDRATLQIDNGLEHEPATRAELLTVMGESYAGLSLFPKADELLTLATSLESRNPVPAEEKVRTLNAYGETLYLAGDYDKAFNALSESVALARRSLPVESQTRSDALTGLADVQTQRGNLSIAVQLCLEALAAERKRPDEPTVLANTLSSLGTAYFQLDKLSDAESTFREELGVLERSVGARDARTGEAMQDLGATLYQDGRFVEAAAMYQRALPVFLSVYGEQHTATATLLNNIARSNLMAGHVDEAESPFRKALAIDEQLEGPTHDDLVSTLNSLGMIDAYRGNVPAARAELARAESIGRLPDHGELLDQVLLNEADLELATGNPTRAAKLLAESKGLLQHAHADDPLNAWRYAVWDSVDAELLAAEGKSDEGRKTLQAAEAVIRSRFGSDGLYTRLAERHAQFIRRVASDAASR
ncbi:MAG TPA: tetratricopeptide repeat protein [Steroidobacteraceae bacterium]|nr:tetratricopeptide repeat protein [Steroidobacteraceae bacterium]